MRKVAIKTIEVICFVALVSFLLAGCGMTMTSGGMIPQGALNFTNNGSVFDTKSQGRWSEFTPAERNFAPQEFKKPKMDMDDCIRAGKRDGWTESDIIMWCLDNAS